MKNANLLPLIYSTIGFILTCLIPFIIAFVKKVKALKAAKTEAEKTKIINELLGDAQQLVVSAEEMYKSYDTLVKQNALGESSGKLKKDKVMTNLQTLCLQKGIEFDADFWSEQVEKLVKVTKSVNASK